MSDTEFDVKSVFLWLSKLKQI